MAFKQIEPLKKGLKGFASLTVEEEHTAFHVGSGTENVLATPVMIALMEAAAVDCVEHLLDVGQTSLGTHVSVDHKLPTPMGHSVKATAELIEIEGRRLKFSIFVEDTSRIIGAGIHIRAVVETEDFRKKVASLL